ncbi:MAG: SAM-dependent methyltransferase [SAR202 cluster bacterium]|jgi:SAM-dependent MidA family methyltransferase|nr:SAM-dependent methyltransferase [SAR202 cluster bacterium]
MQATHAEKAIRSRIDHKGAITFAEFMELALYHPKGGYYAHGHAFGENGDYFTSPSAHPAFGALIAIQLREMWRALDQPTQFYAIEIGAGNGILAADIIEYSRASLGDFGNALIYTIIDRFLPKTPKNSQDAYRITSNSLPLRGIAGCFLSNELLDSFPVHLFEVKNGSLLEIHVTISNGKLVTSLREPSTHLIEDRVRPYLANMPDGYRGEVNTGIGQWMHGTAGALDRGFVLTIDYGYEASNLYSPHRRRGSLQTYYRHVHLDDPLKRVGRQDITSHVDFSNVIEEGNANGMELIGMFTQTDFLHRLGFNNLLTELRRQTIPESEKFANLFAVRELTKSGGLGDFKVLIQGKNTGVLDVDAVIPHNAPSFNKGLPIPFIKPRHIKLFQGRYPHLEMELSQLPFNAIGNANSD